MAISGLGATPAVQIRVRHGSLRPSVSVTVSCVASATETPRETWTPRFCIIFTALVPSLSPISGISFGAMSIRCHWMSAGLSLGYFFTAAVVRRCR